MRHMWLVFTQSVTVVLALFFVVSVLKPQWIHRPKNQLPNTVEQSGVQGSLSYREAAYRALPSVVQVLSSEKAPNKRPTQVERILPPSVLRNPLNTRDADSTVFSQGSGVIVDDRGFILTSSHVLGAAHEVQVTLQNLHQYPATIIGVDPDTDLAVLKIEADEPLTPIEIADSDSLQIGDVVLAIGNPFGVGETVTMGIVSALGRSHMGLNTLENFIQTDAAINPGNSGGALINAQGSLIGVNSAIYSQSSSSGYLGIGFAVPTSTAKKVMDQIIDHGSVTRGWIGLDVLDITQPMSKKYRIPNQGVWVANVTQSGPAANLGIKKGDVLLSVNGIAIKSVQEMLNITLFLPPGDKAQLVLVRAGERFEKEVTVALRPPQAVLNRLAKNTAIEQKIKIKTSNNFQ